MQDKPMHGPLIKTMEEIPAEPMLSNIWLKYGDIKGEKESLLTAAQDQLLNTRYHELKILKTSRDGRCRMCKKYDELVEHILLGSPVLVNRK